MSIKEFAEKLMEIVDYYIVNESLFADYQDYRRTARREYEALLNEGGDYFVDKYETVEQLDDDYDYAIDKAFLNFDWSDEIRVANQAEHWEIVQYIYGDIREHAGWSVTV